MKNKRHEQGSRRPDPIQANGHPTAVSAEFVPKPVPKNTAGFSNDSNAVFDLIPELKGNKFK